MSATDPSFADTELSNTVSLLPLGIRGSSTAAPAAGDRKPRPPIPFPNTELVNRERHRSTIADRARTLLATQEALRIAEAAAVAYANGKLEGDRHGFRRGWTRGTRWGIGVGAFAMLVLGSIGILAALAWFAGRLPF